MLPKEIWQLKGLEDGPNTVILGGTHGNERTGIELINRVMKALGIDKDDPRRVYDCPGVCGNLFIGFGNPAAIAINEREADQMKKHNLNRCFADALLAQPPALDWADLARARELVPFLAKMDLLLDIHATSGDSPPFVCFAFEDPRHRELCRHIPVSHVVMDRNNVLGEDVKGGVKQTATTDAHVLRNGGLALCYETGQQVDFTRVDPVLSVVLRLLLEFRSTTPVFAEKIGLAPSTSSGNPLFCDLERCINAKRKGFTFVPEMKNPWKPLRKGDLIGAYADGEKEFAPCDGILVFPKAENQIKPDTSLYYVMRPCIS